jgi:hypothetical protein
MDAYQALLEKTGGASAIEIGAKRTKAGTVNAMAAPLVQERCFHQGAGEGDAKFVAADHRPLPRVQNS